MKVLFVCLGNICRSPTAEGVFRHKLRAAGLEDRVQVESAGTGDWHVGEPPDPRAQGVARRHGVDISHLRARRIATDDFNRFDHIIALDRQNLAGLQALLPDGARARLSLLLDHVPGREGEAVADPYHGDVAHFEETWRDVTEGARALAQRLGRTP